MQEDQAAPVVYRFRPTRSALLAGLAGLIAVAFGLLAPLSAQAGDHGGHGKGNSDKPWICHPVKGKGESGKGYNVIRPDENSSHIDEKNGKGKHEGRNGKTDSYAQHSGDSWKCETSKPTHTKPTHTKPTHTKPTHPKPTHTRPHKPHPTTTTETETKTSTVTTTATVTTTTEAPATPATTPPPETPATVPPAAPAEPPEEAPFVPEAAPVVEPPAAPVVENVVPQAATDGADLVASDQDASGVRGALLAAGALLLLAAGLLTARRSQSD